MTEPSVPVEAWTGGGAPAELPDVLAYLDETYRAVAEEMATSGVTSMPVVDRKTGLICGSVSAQELLTGRKRPVVRESERNSSYPLA